MSTCGCEGKTATMKNVTPGTPTYSPATSVKAKSKFCIHCFSFWAIVVVIVLIVFSMRKG